MTRRNGSRIAVLFAACTALLLVPSTALAAGGESDWSWQLQWAGVAVNLALILFLAIKWGGPGIKKFLTNRKDAIDKNIADAEELRQQAEARLDEIEKRMQTLDEERQEILDEYTAIGEAEKERIIEQAEKEADRIKEEARIWSETERAKARVAIERQITDLALELAEEKLREKMQPMAQKKLVDDTIEQLNALAG